MVGDVRVRPSLRVDPPTITMTFPDGHTLLGCQVVELVRHQDEEPETPTMFSEKKETQGELIRLPRLAREQLDELQRAIQPEDPLWPEIQKIIAEHHGK
jgi:hypothetical protein